MKQDKVYLPDVNLYACGDLIKVFTRYKKKKRLRKAVCEALTERFDQEVTKDDLDGFDVTCVSPPYVNMFTAQLCKGLVYCALEAVEVADNNESDYRW